MERRTGVYKNLQEAWLAINMDLALHQIAIKEGAQGDDHGSQFIGWDNCFYVQSAELDENFDFGKTMGYKMQKWTSLCRNYVDFHYLSMLKNQIMINTSKKKRDYNLAFHFSNKYGSGKDCLLTLHIAKRGVNKKPIVKFSLRVSEVSKRLLFDFVLLNRIIKYLFDSDWKNVEVIIDCPTMFITPEGIMMFSNSSDVIDRMRNLEVKSNFQKRVLKVYDKYSVMSPEELETITWQVSKRAAKQIVFDDEGNSVSGIKSLKVKRFKLPLPELSEMEVVTPKERSNFTT